MDWPSVFPPTVGSAPPVYRSLSPAHPTEETKIERKHGISKIGKEWPPGFRDGTWLYGHVLGLRTRRRTGIAASSSPLSGTRRQLSGYGRSLRPLQERGTAWTFLAGRAARQRRRRDQVWLPFRS